MSTYHFHASRTKLATQDRRLQLLWALAVTLGICLAILAFVEIAYGGGPARVAGASYFNAAVKGQPLTWADGNLVYYTDRGDLSALLPSADADAFVADAFSRWTSVPTAALTATRAGQLGEDVNTSNVTGYPDGTYTIPADIQPSATDKPIGIVYDFDGAVTSALLGQGAGEVVYCFSNAVFGGPDAYSTDGHLAHALVVINGACVTSAAAVPDVKYRVVRTLGRVIGLDWSQLNNHVITRHPAPTADDYAGFPLMHNFDPPGCTPISRCLPNADSLKMDDRAAVSRLYPVTPLNLAQFSGKQVLASNTARIHGSVYFSDATGAPAQPMTGVNVIARRIDTPGVPSGQFAASSVSGFAYAAVVGNIVNGYTNASGQRYDRFGVPNTTSEGFFDLAGLELPEGADSAQYQLTIEALDNYSSAVGPYAPWQVQPSGAFDPVIVTVVRGGDVAQDLASRDSAIPENAIGVGSSYNTPASLPKNGEWAGWVTGDATAHFFKINALANRTLSVELTALDERGLPVQSKMLPVAGMWALSDGSGAPAPAQSASAFNTNSIGMTRLDAAISQDGDYRIAIADQRGDARPDFRYRARVLYGHALSPNRVGLEGGAAVTVRGTGFRPGLKATVSDVKATVLAVYPGQMTIAVPQLPKDGSATLVIYDVATGSFTTMTDALTIGAASTDNLQLLSVGNPLTPVGTEAANPMRVRVTDAGGAPVEGATIVWDGGPGALLTVCNLQRTCSAFSNENGEAWTRIMPLTSGSNTITATLAPGSYAPAKSVQAVVQSAMSSLDLGISPQYQRAAGATFDATLTVRVVGNGAPIKSKTVTFQFTHGSGTITPASVTTDASGYASTVLHVANASGDTDVVACISPANTVCKTFEVYSVAPGNLRLQPVSGSGQIIPGTQSFAPFAVRVTDAATPPNPVRAAAVAFDVTWLRPVHEDTTTADGDSTSGHHPTPVVLGHSKVTAYSDAEGLVSIVPTPGTWRGELEADIVATTGTSARVETSLMIEAAAGASAAAASFERGHSRLTQPRAGAASPRDAEP